MKVANEAIRYGIETLGVSPDEMFSLIESSNGYDGDDYKRWLASEIIKLVENSGMGYSQLLIKKFNIIQELMDEYSDSSIKEEWLSYFKSILSDNIFSINMEDIGTMIEDVDWFNGYDIDSHNSYFIREELPENFSGEFLKDNNVSLVCKLSSKPCSKDSDMFREAKERGIKCKNEGSLLLYRLCSMVSAFEECTQNFTFAFLVNSKFLYDEDNDQIIKHFLRYFKYEGIVVEANILLSNSYASGEYAFVKCKPRMFEDKLQDGFVLIKSTLEDGKLKLSNIKRYSRSTKEALSSIRNSKELVKTSSLKECIYGYLIFDDKFNLFVNSSSEDSKECIEINESNFKLAVTYFGVVRSLDRFGFSKNIKKFITGNNLFEELFYNCLPLFLFDVNNICSDYNGSTNINPLNVIENESILKLLEDGEVYYSFEAKQLLDICKGFLEFLKGIDKNEVKGKTFEDIRQEADNNNLNKQYLNALTNLKDYVSSLYRKLE